MRCYSVCTGLARRSLFHRAAAGAGRAFLPSRVRGWLAPDVRGECVSISGCCVVPSWNGRFLCMYVCVADVVEFAAGLAWFLDELFCFVVGRRQDCGGNGKVIRQVRGIMDAGAVKRRSLIDDCC